MTESARADERIEDGDNSQEYATGDPKGCLEICARKSKVDRLWLAAGANANVARLHSEGFVPGRERVVAGRKVVERKCHPG